MYKTRSRITACLLLVSSVITASPVVYSENEGPRFQIRGMDANKRVKKAQEAQQQRQPSAQGVMVLPSADLERALASGEIKKPRKVTLEGSDISAELTAAEIVLIREKRDILIKHLFGEEKLKAVREYLRKTEKEKQLRTTEESLFPLAPEDVTRIRKKQAELRRAENAPVGGGINIKIMTIDFDVSNPEPVEIRVAKGYASSIVLFDQTGQPWPVDGDVIGDSSAFTSKRVSQSANIIVFELQKEFSESNALLNLQGMSIPLVLKLISDGKNVDSRLSIRIPRSGPNAKKQTFVSRELNNASPVLMSILNGELPRDAKVYEIEGADGEAIYHGGEVYIRSKNMLLSPPWKESAASVAGHNVYKIPPVTQLIFSVEGTLASASIKKHYETTVKRKKTIYE